MKRRVHTSRRSRIESIEGTPGTKFALRLGIAENLG